jgi:uncharacterized membrane protein YhhN
VRPASAVLLAAVIAGTSYVASWFLPLPAPASVAWKGAGVALLAAYAALNARRLDGWLLAAVLAFGAAGDVLLESSGRTAGALAFLAGHLTAVALYLRNARTGLRPGEIAFGLALVPAIVIAAFLLPPDRAAAGPVALYATGLALMTATAWLSRFPRTLTAAGAMMFAVSDLLIFLRTGRPALDILPVGLAVWGLYFAGQALICLGVTRTFASSGEAGP